MKGFKKFLIAFVAIVLAQTLIVTILVLWVSGKAVKEQQNSTEPIQTEAVLEEQYPGTEK